MLWYKAWLETRSRFFFGVVLIFIVGCGTLYDYRATERLLPIARTIDSSNVDLSGPLGGMIKLGLEAQRDFRGFVWFQWYRQNLSNLIVIFAALLGSGGLLSKGAGGATLFTLSLPVLRRDLLATRVSVGLAELLALAMVPSLVLPLLAPAIGQSYSVLDVLAHGACMFVVGAVFFSLSTMLSTEFSDVWRPLMTAIIVAVGLAVFEYVPVLQPFGLFKIMNGEAYFRHAGLPWFGLAISAVFSAALLRAAAVNLAHKDF